MSAAPPPPAADLNAGLRRLKLAAMRRLALELLITARTQRWNPEEFLRTLVSSIPAATFGYLASVKWTRAAENTCLIGPAAPASHTCWSRAGAGIVLVPVRGSSLPWLAQHACTQ